MYATRMQQRRVERDLSRTALAAKVGCSESYLSRLERGASKHPSELFAQRLASALGVPVNELQLPAIEHDEGVAA